MFCSTIIPTIGRESLQQAVESVLQQSVGEDDFEVIVVNDSGRPLPAAGWQSSERVTILQTQRRERSVARNTGAAVSRGCYLHFLDDDDWLLPGGLEALRQATLVSQAEWIYGRTQLVDRQGLPVLVLDHRLEGNLFVQAMAGEWIPLQSSLIRAESFFQSGGFNLALHGPEDIDLQRRVAMFGNFHGVGGIVACVSMGQTGSMTNWKEHAPASQRARESLLEQTCCWSRLRSSASSAREHRSYWRGRIARLYLTSMVWNVRQRRILAALSRGLVGVGAILLSGCHLAHRKTWQAILHPYESFSFAAGESSLSEKLPRDKP